MSDTTTPENTESETTESDTTTPENTESETTESNTTESDTTETDVLEVDADATEAAEPAATDGEPAEKSVAPARVSRETSRGSAPVNHLEREGDIAADYLEGLLDIADLDGDIDMDVEGDRALVSIVGGDIEHLVGEDGKVLDALQELTRLAVTRETGERSRLMLDVAGHREARRQALTALGTEAATRASSSGEPVRLEPMTPFERKVVHDAVAAAGLTSESEGVEPRRFVVVIPRA